MADFITVEGEVTRSLKPPVKDVEKFPVTEIKAKDRDGRQHVYRGTLLAVILDSAGVTLGANLRGENLVKYVLVTAADNYQVIYALPEIDLSSLQTLCYWLRTLMEVPFQKVKVRSD